jgi:hypothetical protein
MSKELEVLDQLIDEAVSKEKALAVRADELALQSKQFADYLTEKKHNDEALEALWAMVKQYMIDNGLTEHENDYIKLRLTPSGKYRTEDIESVPDELCDVKKVINNKKVKAYYELNGELPEGVESTGYILRKKVK